MSKEEMLKFVSTLAKNKKLSEDWKVKLVDEIAWKIDLQQPSPVKKMFDPKELPFQPDLAKKKSTSSLFKGSETEKKETNSKSPEQKSSNNLKVKKTAAQKQSIASKKSISK